MRCRSRSERGQSQLVSEQSIPAGVDGFAEEHPLDVVTDSCCAPSNTTERQVSRSSSRFFRHSSSVRGTGDGESQPPANDFVRCSLFREEDDHEDRSPRFLASITMSCFHRWRCLVLSAFPSLSSSPLAQAEGVAAVPGTRVRPRLDPGFVARVATPSRLTSFRSISSHRDLRR